MFNKEKSFACINISHFYLIVFEHFKYLINSFFLIHYNFLHNVVHFAKYHKLHFLKLQTFKYNLKFEIKINFQKKNFF